MMRDCRDTPTAAAKANLHARRARIRRKRPRSAHQAQHDINPFIINAPIPALPVLAGRRSGGVERGLCPRPGGRAARIREGGSRKLTRAVEGHPRRLGASLGTTRETPVSSEGGAGFNATRQESGVGVGFCFGRSEDGRHMDCDAQTGVRGASAASHAS